MKILFITFFFPPYKTVASIRTGKTAKLLYKMGHDVQVVSAKNDDLKEELVVEIPIENLHQTNWLDIDSVILNLLGKNKLNARNEIHQGGKQTLKSQLIQKLFSIYRFVFYTPDKYIGWYKDVLEQSEEIISNWKPDIIYASGTPYTGLMVASNLSKKYNIHFVAELRDLWSDNHYDKQHFLGKYLEHRTLKQASAIVTVSNPLVEKLQSKYTHIPCFEIRNAFDDEDFIYTPNIDIDKIIITYTGMMYAGKQDPSILFEAIQQDVYLKANVKCLFYGNALGWVKELAVKYGISENIEVYDPIDRIDVLKLQAESDILLLLTWNDPKEKGIFTGKLFEYIGSSKPILSIGAVDDVASMVIKDNAFGLVSNDSAEIIKFIKMVKNPSHLENISKAYFGNRYLFERKFQIKKLVNIFENIIEKK